MKRNIGLQMVFNYETDDPDEATLLVAETSKSVNKRYQLRNAFYGKEAWELYRTLTRQKDMGDTK